MTGIKQWLLLCGSAAVLSPSLARGQAMPALILGSWRIVKILPTHNPQCWDQEQAKSLVGTVLKYRQGVMTWKGGDIDVPEALSRTLSRRKFNDEYKVDLPELGIRTDNVTEIDLQHEDADITGATTEAPGDTVVLAGSGHIPERIIVSACGVFYEAVRANGRVAGH